jgi:hypothetical protein
MQGTGGSAESRFNSRPAFDLRGSVEEASAALHALEQEEAAAAGVANYAAWARARAALQPLLPEECGGALPETVLEDRIDELAHADFLLALLRLAARGPESDAALPHAEARMARNTRVVAQMVRNRVIDLVARAQEVTEALRCCPHACGPERERALSPPVKIK